MPSLTWNDIPLRRWAAAGLCTESYEEWRVYPTPQAAYAACASPSDLIRVVFGVLPRNEAVGVLCGVIRPVIAPHAPSASMDALTIIERWSAGTATDEEMRAAAARAAAARAAELPAHDFASIVRRRIPLSVLACALLGLRDPLPVDVTPIGGDR